MKERILLLEDEAIIGEVVEEYLTIAGYEVTHRKTGDEALEALENESFALAVLDIMVPGPSGIEVLEHIRKNSPSTAVIMLSALEDEATQLKAFNAQADDYVAKPFSPILLLKRIETILRRVKSSGIQEEEEKLYLHPESYEAYYGGKSLNLTLSEFLLLQALLEHPGWVLSREALIEAIYQDNYYGSDRIIDTHVKNLRKKLPVPYVKTVIGAGYRWEEEE